MGKSSSRNQVSFYYSRIGEICSLGRKYQFSPLFTHATNKHSKLNNILTFSRQPQQQTSQINMKPNQDK